MNAYELAEHADGLAYEIPADWSSGEPKNVATDIANMLRQQADRIAELETFWKDCEEDRTQKCSDCQKQSEPVAWMDEKTGQVSRVACYSIPLYTTPQTKPLSDEEILEEYRQCYGDEGTLTDCYFARAIEAKVRGEK